MQLDQPVDALLLGKIYADVEAVVCDSRGVLFRIADQWFGPEYLVIK